MFDLPHSYKITNKQTGMIYIGICFKRGKTHLDRFEEHLNGMGSLHIKKEIDSGGFSRYDYEVEFIDYYSDELEASKAETELIKKYDSYHNGLNGNPGGGFGGTSRRKNFYRQWCWKLPSIHYGKDYYSNDTQERKNRRIYWKEFERIDSYLSGYTFWERNWLTIFDSIVRELGTRNIVKVLDYKHFSNTTKDRIVGLILNDCCDEKILSSLVRFIEEGKNTPAYSHTQINKDYSEYIFDLISTDFSKNFNNQLIARFTHANKNPHESEGWLEGRRKYRNRVKDKNFTQKEIEGQIKTKERVKREWESKTYDERIERTSAGLDKMNKKNLECPYCGKSGLTKGNAKRWHFDNCKHREVSHGLFES